MDLNIAVYFILVVFLIGALAIRMSNKSFNLKKKHIVDYLSDIVHQVKIEKLGDIEYWYDEQNHQFLSQGPTVDDIINTLKIRFPDHIFLLDNVGGVAAATDWKIVDFKEFEKINLLVSKNA
jgi:hypothetical protein